MGGKPTLADEWAAAEDARNLRVAEERARRAEQSEKWLRILLRRWCEDYPGSVTAYDRVALEEQP
jgi:hypothetical protein